MMANSSNKAGTGEWRSVDDVLQTFYSLSRVTKGTGPKCDEFLMSNQSAESPDAENYPDSLQSQHESTSEEVKVDENPSYVGVGIGVGRGKYLKELEKRFSRQHLDETIHNELRQLFKADYSNAAIESHFASTCSSSNESITQETTRVFHDPNPEYYPREVEFVIGESNILKKISEFEKPRRPVKKLPRCRNALILSLTQKKDSEQDVKIPELKGPDVFLSSKSYSNTVSAPGTSSSNQDGEPILNEEDFPPL